MTHNTYVSGGLCRRPRRRDVLDGYTELLLYNPTDQSSTVTMTAYFERRAPHVFAPFELAAETNVVLVAPTMDRAVFEDCGFWGARFESSTPLIAVLISLVGDLGNPCPDPMFKGGATHFLGTDLHTQWHFADGLWLDWKRAYNGDVSKAPFPFNELEYYYFLNPGPQDAAVEMTLQYRNLAHTTMQLTVPSGRTSGWCNFEQVPYNQPYGVSVRSSEPITTTSVRYIYGLNGFDDWGLNIHIGMPAEPGPITD
jgi:hypothetical protein